MGNVDDTSKELGMLLSSYQPNRLVSEEERFNLSLRRNLYRRKVIDLAADEILQNGKAKTSGASHSDYINRLDVFAVKGGCIYKDNFLPKWAKGSAKNFFKAADQYERKNGVPYFEYQLSLQNELTLEQNLEIVNTFIRKSELLKDKYYAFAIHDKQAALDKSQRQIHCHLMFSTRCIDDVERKHERDAKTFFARANSKDPAKGGCKKDRRFNWDNPKERTAVLMRTRKLWEDIVNATFRKYGMDEQISTKTLEAQREEALKQKDYLKAEILNRAPEKKLGPDVCANPNDPLVINIKQARTTNKKRIALLEAAHEMKQLMNDERLTIKFSSALNESEKLKNDYTNNEELKGTNFDKLIKSIEELSTQLIEKRKNVISYNGAVGLARLQQMTSNEYYAFRDYRYSVLQDKKLRKELSYLEQKAIKPERQSQIKILLAKYKDIRLAQKDAIEKLNTKFSTPKYKSRITKRANVILKENAPLRQEADILANKLADMSATLRESIAKQLEAIKKANETIPAYTAVQINHIINTIRFDLEKQIKAKQQDLHVLYPKIISEDRAKVMGVDIVTNGESKRLRELMNSINKDKQRLEGAKENINILKYDMAGLDHKSEDYLDYKAAYDKNVANKKTLTEQIATNTTIANNLKAKLIDTFKQPAIRTKTQNIINGILQKNLPLKTQYDTMLKSVNSMKQQVNQLAKLQKGINAQVRLDKNKNITYCLKPSSINTASAGLTSAPKPYKQSDTNNARILAEAFSGKIDLGVQIFRIEDDKYDEYADYYSRSKADVQAKESDRGIDL